MIKHVETSEHDTTKLQTRNTVHLSGSLKDNEWFILPKSSNSEFEETKVECCDIKYQSNPNTSLSDAFEEINCCDMNEEELSSKQITIFEEEKLNSNVYTRQTWMTSLPDSVLLFNINLPGTHDSAAINRVSTTPWACQDKSIASQLNRGIRLFDLRLKVLNVKDTSTIENIKIESTPYIAPNLSIVFQGESNDLSRVSINGSNFTSMWGLRTLSTPFVDGDFVYFQNESNRLIKASLDLPLGTKLSNTYVRGTPFISDFDGYVYLWDGDSKLLARTSLIEASSFEYLGTEKLYSSPFVYKDEVFFEGKSQRLLKYNITQNTTIVLHQGANGRPIVDNGFVYFKGKNYELWKMDKDGKQPALRLGNTETTLFPPVVDNGYVYFVAANSQELYQIKMVPIDNKTPATYLGSHKSYSELFISQGRIFFLNQDRYIQSIDTQFPFQGYQIGSVKSNSVPFVSGNYCYFQGPLHQLFKIDIGLPTSTNPVSPATLDSDCYSQPFVLKGFICFASSSKQNLFRIIDVGGYFQLNTTTVSTPIVHSKFIYFNKNGTLARAKDDPKSGFDVEVLKPNMKGTPFSNRFQNRIYYLQPNDLIAFYDVNSGSTTTLPAETMDSPILNPNGFLFYRHLNTGELFSLDANQASPNPQPLNIFPSSRPFPTNNEIFFKDTKSYLTRADLNGTNQEHIPSPPMSSAPTFFDGYICYRSSSGRLIRITYPYHDISFATCHGNIGSKLSLNEFESLSSVLKEMVSFLKKNERETIVVKVKIDDWQNFANNDPDVLATLDKKLISYPYYNANSPTKPTLGDVRNKIFFLNQVEGSLSFGPYINWVYNPPSPVRTQLYDTTSLKQVIVPVVVQDHFYLTVGSSVKSKVRDVLSLLNQITTDKLALNFASGVTIFQLFSIDANPQILEAIGNWNNSQFGWSFWDYPFEGYVYENYGSLQPINPVDYLIDSNFPLTARKYQLKLGRFKARVDEL